MRKTMCTKVVAYLVQTHKVAVNRFIVNTHTRTHTTHDNHKFKMTRSERKKARVWDKVLLPMNVEVVHSVQKPQLRSKFLLLPPPPLILCT